METYSIGKEAECNGWNMSEFLYMKPPLDAHNYRLTKGEGCGRPHPPMQIRSGATSWLGIKLEIKTNRRNTFLDDLIFEIQILKTRPNIEVSKNDTHVC
ncbi:hypothetical protein CDAR_43731 [Caerostris darwini]|uniref:Uncharacterized protein n=1 Tax=Caerostris darwini TaxID=1538125 RepID=A0AAV4WKM7_9ARAC|nr:hypothetical protein CDAR_43731 [Caerostris darwini]